jgi:beta-galactosidase
VKPPPTDDRAPPLVTEVRTWRGAPTLFVNGEPDTGLMFWHSRVENAAEELAGLARHGVRLVSAGFSTGLAAGGGFDHGAADARIAAILAASPDALILPRVSVVPPEWWLDLHPSQRMVHLDELTGEPTLRSGARVSFASAAWRDDFAAALAAFISHCERHHQRHVLGYHIGGGQFGEWSYAWENVLSDYSEPQTEAFRRWLRRRYGDDVAALRAAWADASADFAAAGIPRDRTRLPRQTSLFDPSRERRHIDYLEFHSWIAADALLHFARAARQALAAAGAKKVVGAFYGYHFQDVAVPANLLNCGHHAVAEVLASPDVDFLCAPYSYQERHAGGIHRSQIAAGSVSLHGKLLWSEDDTRTHLAAVSAAYGRCTTSRRTVGVLRRNLVGTLGAGGTQWWMDLAGAGWYRDEGLLDAVGELARLARRVQEAGRSPRGQVAVIASARSLAHFRHDAALTDALLSRQMSELLHAGFPLDVFLAEDLERVFSEPWCASYHLVVFLDAVYLTRAERDAIRGRVARDGRTLLWVHAAGLATESRLDPAAQRDVTGFTVHLGDPLYGDEAWPLMVETSLGGTRLVYGAGGRIGPILFGEDPDAETWGWLLHPDRPGLLHRDFGEWRSVWSAAPGIPAPVLRAIASRAGVHVYTDTGDQVLAAGPYLAVHATADGQRTIRLPSPSVVHDAVAERLVADRATSIVVELERGDTAIWRIG